MLINRLLTISLGFVLGIASASAQGWYSERQLDKRVDQYSFEQAVSGYEFLVTNKKHKGPETYLKIANLYYGRSLYKKAVDWYTKAADEKPEIFLEHEIHRFSNALKFLEHYELSDFWTERYNLTAKKQFPTNVRDKVQQLKDIKITKLTNSNSDILYASGFVPGSNDVLTTKFTESASYGDDKAVTNLYSFKILEGDSLSASALEPFEMNFDTQFNIGEAIMTRDGKTLYFSSNVSTTNKQHKKAKKTNQYKLFQASLENNTWTNITELPFNSNRLFSSGHPTLSPNEDWMYFASDRPGGEGEMDLYRMARSAEGSFGTPENLGPKINTPFNEGFPTVINDTLYFSSNAHTNLGGIDIFYSVISPNGFSDPVNLGTPINSSADDFAFLQHPSKKIALIASNRVSDGDQIFLIEGNLNPNKCSDKIQGQVVDIETRKPIPFATVTTYSGNEPLEEVQTDSLGNFQVNKHPCAPQIFHIVAKAKSKVYLPFTADIVSEETQAKLILPLGKQEFKIYFDLNSSAITDEAKVVLDSLVVFLKESPTVKIEIRSHTDSRASNEYNIWLSDRRASKSYDYLVNKGISANRLSRQGFGESQLTNDCHDDAGCSEEFHRLNRRSEFIITNE